MILPDFPNRRYKKYIIIDTETTGFFEDDVILQMSWLVLDEHLNLVGTRDYIIRVSRDIVITNSHIHGITNQVSKEKGQDLSLVLYHLEKDVLNEDVLVVGHNIEFDMKFILKSCEHPNNKKLKDYLITSDWFCTMTYGTNVCCIPSKWCNGKFKFPKLIQLYEFLFSKSPGLELHNSLNDCITTKDCFVKLMELHSLHDLQTLE